jgi:hypothetical protein
VSDAAEVTSMEVDPSPSESRASGRGLFLVDTLSTRWGVSARAKGKQVWFELDLK